MLQHCGCKEAPRRLFLLPALFSAALPAAWLLPNHYYPWPSAWQDGAALALLCIAALLCRSRAAVPAQWAAALAVALGSVALQWAEGRIGFAGDALMALFYLAAFALAIGLGTALVETPVCTKTGRQGEAGFVELFATGIFVGATVSTAVALVQWTGALSLGVWGADLPPGARPFGNVAQPNHLCTIAFFGLASLAVLREGGRIGAVGYWAGAIFMLLAMVMSGSRTGVVQLAVAFVLLLVLARRASARTGARSAALLLVLLVLGKLAWPALNDALLLDSGRALTAQMQGGTRALHWATLADAIGRSPWGGYGWQQVVLAQQAGALNHPPVGEHIEHSHNFVLDLFVWAGVPVGGLIALLVGWALWRQLCAASDARALWLLMAVCGLFVHGLLEYPLEYAYFLVPAGLALGAAWALEAPPPVRHLPAPTLPAAGALLGALLLVVAIDYFEAEQNHRALRLESARIGVAGLETPAPTLRVLDQQQAFLEFARTEARIGMSADELERMRIVTQRFAYPPSMFRYALAAGLNDQSAAATLTLARLCLIHPPPRCEEARDSWRMLEERYPVLRAVELPAMPAQD